MVSSTSSLPASALTPLWFYLGFMEVLEPRGEPIKIIALIWAFDLRLNEIDAAFDTFQTALDLVGISSGK